LKNGVQLVSEIACTLLIFTVILIVILKLDNYPSASLSLGLRISVVYLQLVLHIILFVLYNLLLY